MKSSSASRNRSSLLGKLESLPAWRKATPFQQKVWKKLLEIPRGETRTYAWVAEEIGRPKAVRAVGSACGKNPFPIVVPCHRVLASSGSLGGYAYGLPLKRFLLLLEKARIRAKI